MSLLGKIEEVSEWAEDVIEREYCASKHSRLEHYSSLQFVLPGSPDISGDNDDVMRVDEKWCPAQHGNALTFNMPSESAVFGKYLSRPIFLSLIEQFEHKKGVKYLR